MAVAARLQPGPRARHHGVVEGGHQARQHLVHAGCDGHQHRLRREAHDEREIPGQAVEQSVGLGRVGPARAALVVGDGQLSYRGAQQHGPVGSRSVTLGRPLALALQPRRQRRRRLEVVGAGLRVGRVDEAPHPFQRLRRPSSRAASPRRARSDRGGRSGDRRGCCHPGCAGPSGSCVTTKDTTPVTGVQVRADTDVRRPGRGDAAASRWVVPWISAWLWTLFSVTAARIECLHGLLVDLLVLAEVDGPPRVPSRLELKRPAGSSSAAPLAKVILTMSLYVSPVQIIPSCVPRRDPAPLPLLDDVGIGLLDRGSRSRPSSSPRQSPSSSMRSRRSAARGTGSSSYRLFLGAEGCEPRRSRRRGDATQGPRRRSPIARRRRQPARVGEPTTTPSGSPPAASRPTSRRRHSTEHLSACTLTRVVWSSGSSPGTAPASACPRRRSRGRSG